MEHQHRMIEVEGPKDPAVSGLTDGLTVIVPAFNEESGIGPVLGQLLQALAAIEIPYEVIVVDDGSTDRTAEIASSVEGVRVLHHRQNRGYGAAIKSGIRYARHEFVCITDADGTYPNHHIPDLLAALVANNHDMVVGARVGDNVAIPLVRRPAKWAISQLARAIAGASIPDINSGLRIFKRSVVRRFYRVLPDGFSFTTTITLGMLANDYSVSFIPIEYYPRVGKSKIKPIRDTLNFVQLILRIALYFSPLKIFLPLSGFFLLFGLAWGGISYLVFGGIADASMAVIIMAAIQIAVVGLLADLINHRLPGLQNPAVFEDSRER
jgi:glycosyltransferase involved in cell wall biosynthesis